MRRTPHPPGPPPAPPPSLLSDFEDDDEAGGEAGDEHESGDGVVLHDGPAHANGTALVARDSAGEAADGAEENELSADSIQRYLNHIGTRPLLTAEEEFTTATQAVAMSRPTTRERRSWANSTRSSESAPYPRRDSEMLPAMRFAGESDDAGCCEA